ncbi:unnamed protein product [Protopolystoma xenopodis]|uniref:Uncharacterized protein n=1 Tax=Protopolystoma xenopodis TaxID=117903 RepID=A0A3S4ZNJ2_9PLAT|nr:unnamed protein product [Protopolystoma xenopodis]
MDTQTDGRTEEGASDRAGDRAGDTVWGQGECNQLTSKLMMYSLLSSVSNGNDLPVHIMASEEGVNFLNCASSSLTCKALIPKEGCHGALSVELVSGGANLRIRSSRLLQRNEQYASVNPLMNSSKPSSSSCAALSWFESR